MPRKILKCVSTGYQNSKCCEISRVLFWHFNDTIWSTTIIRNHHDDVIKWKHFPHHWSLVRGIGDYCSAMHSSSALQTCEYFNITWRMLLIWAPLQFVCIWGCSSNEISLAETIPPIQALYIRGCMLGSDLTYWPPNLESHWNQTSWCKQPVVSQWQPSGNLHNWNTLEDNRGRTGNTLAANTANTAV